MNHHIIFFGGYAFAVAGGLFAKSKPGIAAGCFYFALSLLAESFGIHR